MAIVKAALLKGKKQEGTLPVMFCGKLTRKGLTTKKVAVRGKEMDCGEGSISMWGNLCVRDAAYMASRLGVPNGKVNSVGGAVYADITAWGPAVKRIAELGAQNREIIGLGNVKVTINDKGLYSYKINVSGVLDYWQELEAGQHIYQCFRPIFCGEGVPCVVATKVGHNKQGKGKCMLSTALLPKKSTSVVNTLEAARTELGAEEVTGNDSYYYLNVSDFSKDNTFSSYTDCVGCGYLQSFNGKLSLVVSDSLMASPGVWEKKTEDAVSGGDDVEYTIA